MNIRKPRAGTVARLFALCVGFGPSLGRVYPMKPARKVLTTQDVARVAGVSISTVSRVLNNKDDVASETYEKVQNIIQELGYNRDGALAICVLACT
jgi:transcriptional regulator with XRE-family HTH domain